MNKYIKGIVSLLYPVTKFKQQFQSSVADLLYTCGNGLWSAKTTVEFANIWRQFLAFPPFLKNIVARMYQGKGSPVSYCKRHQTTRAFPVMHKFKLPLGNM